MRAATYGGFEGLGTSRLYGGLAVALVRGLASVAGAALPRRRSAPLRGPDLREVVAVLRGSLALRGYAPGTAVKYASCVSSFLRTVRPQAVEELTHEDVESFLRKLRLAGKSNGTLRVQLCALRTVFDKVLGMHITCGIAHAPRPAPIPPADAEDVKAVMIAARRKPRDRLVVDMLNRSKLRQGTLRLLKAPAGGSSLFTASSRGSTGGRRVAPGIVPLEIAEDGAGALGWLLPSPARRTSISTRTIRRIVERYAAACGVSITCTAIRKAAVVPIRAVA